MCLQRWDIEEGMDRERLRPKYVESLLRVQFLVLNLCQPGATLKVRLGVVTAPKVWELNVQVQNADIIGKNTVSSGCLSGSLMQ